MKTVFMIAVLAVLLVNPGVCFALWETELVTKDRAKELGMEVRTKAAGPNHVQVELEFKPEDKLKDFSQVDLRLDQGDNLTLTATLREAVPPIVLKLRTEGDNPTLTATLREDRSKPGRVAVSFTADTAQLDKLTLRVIVPFLAGGTVYELRVKDFVEPKKDR